MIKPLVMLYLANPKDPEVMRVFRFANLHEAMGEIDLKVKELFHFRKVIEEKLNKNESESAQVIDIFSRKPRSPS